MALTIAATDALATAAAGQTVHETHPVVPGLFPMPVGAFAIIGFLVF